LQGVTQFFVDFEAEMNPDLFQSVSEK
jgi:hypothetical protein